MVASFRRMTGSINTTRVLAASEGPVTLYPTAHAVNCTFGGSNFIGGGTTLNKSKIGRYTYIGERCRMGNITIGSFCSIASEVVAGLGTHPTHMVSTHPVFYSPNNSGFPISFARRKLVTEGIPVAIGNDVWIGYRSIIFDGVTIGDGAVVGAGAVVSRDVEPYSVVAGVPARHLRYRFSPETIQSLIRIRWWDRDISWIKEHASQFADIEEFLRSSFIDERIVG